MKRACLFSPFIFLRLTKTHKAGHCAFVSYSYVLKLIAAVSILMLSAKISALATSPAENFRDIKGNIEIAGQSIDYTARAGTLVLRDNEGTPYAEVFYMAYIRDSDDTLIRPLTFLWGGGPGGASEAANIAGFGPLRISSKEKLSTRDAPYELSPNGSSLLDISDLVFIDPIGTGYSRPLGDKKGEDFWGLHQDANSVAAAITRYVDVNNRWVSPKFLWGVSYGTARASMLSNLLQQQGMGLNGTILVAPALNFGYYSYGLDHQFIATLPTMAAIAWYHGRVSHDGYADKNAFLETVRQFAYSEYAQALAQGNRLSDDDRKYIADRLNSIIGLDKRYLLDANLRVSAARFQRELLRDKGLVIGRLDGRATGRDHDNVGEYPESDPSIQAGEMFPLTALFKQHLAEDFEYRSSLKYIMANQEAIIKWDWHHDLPETAGIPMGEIEDRNIFPMTAYPAAELAAAMRSNRQLKVLVANAYYDLATPFEAADYDIRHMTFDNELKENVTMKYYDAGHAMYMDDAVVVLMKNDIASFMNSALGGNNQQ